jgi:hypothetical protein
MMLPASDMGFLLCARAFLNLGERRAECKSVEAEGCHAKRVRRSADWLHG